jgi:chromosomal replication initiation ATPase DnaA
MPRHDHWADVRDRSVRPLKQSKKRLLPLAPEAPLEEIAQVERVVSEKEAQIEHLYTEIEALTGSTGPHLGHRIARAIARLHRISYQDLCSHRRAQHLVVARHHAMYEMRKHTKLSLPAIGKILNGRDHTTIIHGCKQHEKRLKMGEVQCGPKNS